MTTSLTRYLSITCALVVTSAWTFASAQQKADNSQDAGKLALQTIVVTSTRIVRPGFVAPTPVTALSSQDLQVAGYTTVGQALQDLPMYKGTLTPAADPRNTTTEGMNIADLRGLGYQRTLVLIDGERPVFESPVGFDINTIPSSLVERVDVVTGGASAAWGSDAVAGVINVVLDNRFVGERVQVQYGQDGQGYGKNYMASAAFGTNFGADDRGHFMVGVQWTDSSMIPTSSVPQLGNYFLKNPGYSPSNGAPMYIVVPNYNFSGESAGGLIVSGPLKGTAFGPGGTPYAFDYGAYANSTYMSGGDPEAVSGRFYPTSSAQDKDDNKNLYSRLSYEVSDNLKLHADLMYAHFFNVGAQVPLGTNYIGGPFQIQDTNAFLPASIASEMAAHGISSFLLGRGDADFGGVGGNLSGLIHTQTFWGSIGAEGAFGDNWTYSLFYNHGATTYHLLWGPQVMPSLLQESLNSVEGPSGPVCASMALKNPITGASCVPVDPFGPGAPSAAALSFFEGYASSDYTLTQNEAGGEVQGEPFSTWAGPVSIVGGGEWRTEALEQTADPYSLAGDFAPVNYTDESGRYSVAEGFVETVIPLLKDLPAIKEVDFNGGVRESHYSTSGSIASWKLGLTDRVSKQFLLRGTYSRDIRAPNLSELYTNRSVGAGPIIDPQNGNTQYSIIDYSGGNPDLKPEIARTATYGLVFTPAWLPRFDLSVDWWDINIHGAITTESAQTEVNYCAEGDTSVCQYIVRNAQGLIQYVNTTFINLDQLNSSGLDAEASYVVPLRKVWKRLPGTLESHLLMTYVDKMDGNDGVEQSNAVGSLLNLATAPAQLRWRSTLTETYSDLGFRVYARLRFLSGGYYEPPPITVNLNQVHSQFYLDVGASYSLSRGGRYQLYANVINAANRQSPPIPAPIFYDEFGRVFNVGLRASF